MRIIRPLAGVICGASVLEHLWGFFTKILNLLSHISLNYNRSKFSKKNSTFFHLTHQSSHIVSKHLWRKNDSPTLHQT